jgi:hypothetical protein
MKFLTIFFFIFSFLLLFSFPVNAKSFMVGDSIFDFAISDYSAKDNFSLSLNGEEYVGLKEGDSIFQEGQEFQVKNVKKPFLFFRKNYDVELEVVSGEKKEKIDSQMNDEGGIKFVTCTQICSVGGGSTVEGGYDNIYSATCQSAAEGTSVSNVGCYCTSCDENANAKCDCGSLGIVDNKNPLGWIDSTSHEENFLLGDNLK